MYERRSQKPLSRIQFASRLLHHLLGGVLLISASLAFGIWGYQHYEGLSFVDAFLNTAMLLGGMGPVNLPVTIAGKWFAGVYALYAGLVFIVTVALLVTPVAHRVLHKFHWDDPT